MPTLRIDVETFPIAGRFAIARGAKTEARVVTVVLENEGATGRGECVPYARYGESVESVVAAIRGAGSEIERGIDRTALQALLPHGAARNAVDCAFWDLEAKTTRVPVFERAGLPAPTPVVTAFTISLDAPEAMGAAAAIASARPLLKIKLGGADDPACLRAVRAAAPRAALIVDANEGWQEKDLAMMFDVCVEAGVVLIEQPLRADHDDALMRLAHPIPVCADESMHDRTGLTALRDRYDAINVKLDKTGGLTEALAVIAAARDLGFGLMIGCMVGTSLAMAPALLLAGEAAFVDLDGPLLLARDRPDGLRFDGSTIAPADPALWG